MWQASFPRASPRNSVEHQDMLRIACLHNDVETIRKLCKVHNVNIEIEDSHCTTPLMLACYYGCYESADELLSNQKALVDHGDIEDVKPIHYACEQQHIRVVELLIEHNADIHSQTQKGATALHFAAESGNFELIKLLLLNGAKKTIKDNYDQSPLDIASRHKMADILCLFQSTNHENIRHLRSNSFASHSHHRNSSKSSKHTSRMIELERERIVRGEISSLKAKLQSLQYEKHDVHDVRIQKLTKRMDSIEQYIQQISDSVQLILYKPSHKSLPNVSITVPKPIPMAQIARNSHSKAHVEHVEIAMNIDDTPMTELNSPYDDDDDDDDIIDLPDFGDNQSYDTDDGKLDLVQMPSLQPEANSLEIGYSYDPDPDGDNDYDTATSSRASIRSKGLHLTHSLSNIIDVEDVMSPIHEESLTVTPYKSDDPTPLPAEYPQLQHKYQSSPTVNNNNNNNAPFEYNQTNSYRRSRSQSNHRRIQTEHRGLKNRLQNKQHEYSNPPAQLHIDEYLKTKSDPETYDDEMQSYPDLDAADLDDKKNENTHEEVIISEEEYAKLMGINTKVKVRRNSDPSPSPHGSPSFGLSDGMHTKVPPLAIPNSIGIINGTISPDTVDAVSRTTKHHENMVNNVHHLIFDEQSAQNKIKMEINKKNVMKRKSRTRSAGGQRQVFGLNSGAANDDHHEKKRSTKQRMNLLVNVPRSPFNKRNVNTKHVAILPLSPTSPLATNSINAKRLYNLIDSYDPPTVKNYGRVLHRNKSDEQIQVNERSKFRRSKANKKRTKTFKKMTPSPAAAYTGDY